MNTPEYAELAASLERLGDRELSKRHKYKLAKHDREEVIQDALIELTHSLEQGFVDVPEALFRVILDRRAIDRGRRNDRRLERETPVGDRADLAKIELKRVADNKPDFSLVTPPRPLTGDDQLLVTALDQTVRALPDDIRSAFILVDLRGLSTYEAAPILGLSAEGVRLRLETARGAIRSALS